MVAPALVGLMYRLVLHEFVGIIPYYLYLWMGDSPSFLGAQTAFRTLVTIEILQWTPFALLILLTAIQSLDNEQKEAARMDGAGPLAMFWFIILPHLGRAISVVVMIETIFFLTIFAEIFVTTSGGPGLASTNLAFLIYIRALLEFDVGGASAGGVIAIVLANVVALFLMWIVGRNLDR